MSKSNVVAFIFARGGSKGVPRKNLRPLAGKPLIVHSIETALACPVVDRVVVSTEDEEIASVALEHGAEVPFRRPQELATDDAPEWLAWQHALEVVTAVDPGAVDIFLSVPSTAPLRVPADLEAVVTALQESEADIIITVRPAECNPYFTMVTLDARKRAQLVMKPDAAIHRRQAAPEIFDITSVAYAARPAYIREAKSVMEGDVGAVVVPAERALDIDTEFDFRIAECLLVEKIGRD